MQYKQYIDPYLSKQINNQRPYLNSLRSPSFHHPIQNSLLCQSISEQKLKLSVDQESQTKLNNIGQSQWEKYLHHAQTLGLDPNYQKEFNFNIKKSLSLNNLKLIFHNLEFIVPIQTKDLIDLSIWVSKKLIHNHSKDHS